MGARSWAIIDLDAARANAAAVRAVVGPGCRILAAVKADAYGHGAVQTARAFLAGGADRLGVADTAEARELREAGVAAPIHTLGALLPEEADAAVELDLRPDVASYDEALRLSEAAGRASRRVKVHLHVDTGMGRYGARPEEAARTALRIARLAGTEIEGASTHFPVAESDEAFTSRQLARFAAIVAEIERSGVKLPLTHAANSAATVLCPESRLSMVRPGLMLYGLSNTDETARAAKVTPVMTWKSRVVFAKEIRPGETVGYGRTYSPAGPRRIATISAGYADGYPLALSGNSEVLLGGRRCPVVGRVSMDYITIDATGVDFEIGDEAVLMGRQGAESISCEWLARRAGTIPYVITTCMGSRTARVTVGAP